MKMKILSTVVLASILGVSISLRASTPIQVAGTPVVSQNRFEAVAFSDSAEAGMLRRSYWILNWADKDYKGHRAKAMKEIKAAAALLGVDLNAGEDRAREKQAWSDDRLRTADDLLSHVLAASGVKDQPRINKHVSEAMNQLSIALSIH
ncbi:MAG TPA: hypothetical protein VGN23_04580 [Verrucomicrobiae bacterium]